MTPRTKHAEKLKGLYAITDEYLIPAPQFQQAVTAALQGGAKIIQYRDKSNDKDKRVAQANILRHLCEQHDALCIINDDIELAKIVDADGVHLGRDDVSIAEARTTLGDDAIIGVSCYNNLSLAIKAEHEQADYVAFGAIFSSSTKPGAVVVGLDILHQARHKVSLPICSIGGISTNNIQQVVEHGSDMVAMINSVFAGDDIKQAAFKLSQYF